MEELRKEFVKKSSISDFVNKNLKVGRRGQQLVPNDNKKVAVRNLSLSFRNGEIFGLLGPNGAGKTTTISIITTDLLPDAGLVKICDQRLNINNFNNFCNNVAACPQHNPFWSEITLREHLILYASIKGIPEDNIMEECEEYMKMLDIAEHADKRVKNLSGGTKRKLAFIISMFGSPTVALLDGD